MLISKFFGAMVLLACLDPAECNIFDAEIGAAWKDWWTYETDALAGEGPRNWATVNEAWRLCRVGRRQSPVDVPLGALVFASALPPLVFLGDPVRHSSTHYSLNETTIRSLRSQQRTDPRGSNPISERQCRSHQPPFFNEGRALG